MALTHIPGLVEGLADPSGDPLASRAGSLVAQSEWSGSIGDAQDPGTRTDGDRQVYVVFLQGMPQGEALAVRVTDLLERVEAGQEAAPRLFGNIGGFAASLSQEQATRLAAQAGVASVEADHPVGMIRPIPAPSPDQELKLAEPVAQSKVDSSAVGTRALTSYANTTASSGETLPWGVRSVWGGLDLTNQGNFGIGTYAFVIDSGVLSTTGDLRLNTAWARSWISGETPFTDGNGHGTHVAGTIAALANGKGVVGVAPGAEVVPLKVFDSSGGGASTATVADAINYAVGVINANALDKSKVVINMSLGGPADSTLETAVRNAASQGIRFAIAAGNDGKDVDGYSPANAGDAANVFTTSAVDSAYAMASWSNWDRIDATDSVDDVDFAAPGVGVLSYYKNGALTNLSGTSMATPHVAGLLLMGGISAGDAVKPYIANTADPFALAANTSFSASYALSSAGSVIEGNSLAVSVATNQVAANTTLYWRFSGSGITGSDFTNGQLTGTALVQADGSAVINVGAANDGLAESSETLKLELFTSSTFSGAVASTNVVIQDPAAAPPPGLVLWGTTASDSITGGAGNDRIAGVPATGATASALGAPQIDTLTGGQGADVFLLGDSVRGVYYNDGDATKNGSADAAQIRDFQSGLDKLQLFSGSYFTTVSAGVTTLYLDSNKNGALNLSGSSPDEIIATIQGSAVRSTDIIWV